MIVLLKSKELAYILKIIHVLKYFLEHRYILGIHLGGRNEGIRYSYNDKEKASLYS